MLEQDDVDVQPAEDPRRADVVAANRLAIVATSPGRCGRDGSLTIDDLLDPVDPVDAEQRCAHVGRKGADAARRGG